MQCIIYFAPHSTVLPSSLIYVSAPVLYIYSNEVYTVYAHFHETLHCSVHFFFIMYVGMLYYCHIYIKTQFFRNSYVSLHKKKTVVPNFCEMKLFFSYAFAVMVYVHNTFIIRIPASGNANFYFVSASKHTGTDAFYVLVVKSTKLSYGSFPLKRLQ